MSDPLIVIHGDCLDVMRAMDEASVDAIVTDPPYELGFMGRAWDKVEGIKTWRAAMQLGFSI